MIFDPTIEVICDLCGDNVYIELEYQYTSYSGNSGHYNTSDSYVNEKLVDECEWIVDGDKHFCCEDCKEGYSK